MPHVCFNAAICLFSLVLPSSSMEEVVNSHKGSCDFVQCLLYSTLSCIFSMLIGHSLFSDSGAELNSYTGIVCSFIIISALFLLLTITKH